VRLLVPKGDVSSCFFSSVGLAVFAGNTGTYAPIGQQFYR
jgi:hypothetical protein